MGRKAEWIPEEMPHGTGKRAVAVGFYLALVTARCLELIGHAGRILVEGPFAKNRCYCKMLAAATGSEVVTRESVTGTSRGAALLVDASLGLPDRDCRMESPAEQDPRMCSYAAGWQKIV